MVGCDGGRSGVGGEGGLKKMLVVEGGCDGDDDSVDHGSHGNGGGNDFGNIGGIGSGVVWLVSAVVMVWLVLVVVTVRFGWYRRW